MFSFDSRGIKPSQITDPIPEGDYLFEIVNTQEKTSSAGNQMILVTCAVIGATEHAGAGIFHNVTFLGRGTPGAGMAIHFLKTIGEPFEETEDLDIIPQRWIGKRFRAKVTVEKYIRPDKSESFSNKIKSVMPEPENDISF